jgi:hypothetical protein
MLDSALRNASLVHGWPMRTLVDDVCDSEGLMPMRK